MLDNLINSLENIQNFAINAVKYSFFVFLGVIVLETIFIMAVSSSYNSRNPQETVAHALLSNLNHSAAVYAAQQRTAPNSFKDFVVPDGLVTGKKTLTLENINSQLKDGKIAKITDPLVLEFSIGCKATYYLTGTDVTAKFEGF